MGDGRRETTATRGGRLSPSPTHGIAELMVTVHALYVLTWYMQDKVIGTQTNLRLLVLYPSKEIKMLLTIEHTYLKFSDNDLLPVFLIGAKAFAIFCRDAAELAVS